MKNSQQSTSQPIRSVSGLGICCIWQWFPQLLALAGTASVIAIVISGSLGVGDSIQHGLLRMANQRLGGIAVAIIGEEPFERQFSERLNASFQQRVDGEFSKCRPELIPAIVVEMTVERPAGRGQSRSSAIATLLGCDKPSALRFDVAASEQKGVQLSQRLVDLLELKVGDPVVLRVNERSAVPSDMPLGSRRSSSLSRRVILTDILPPGSVGDFSLSSTEPPAGVALVSLTLAEELLGWSDKRNGVFLAGDACHQSFDDILQQCLKPSLADLGLSLMRYPDGEWIGLTSRRMVLEQTIDAAAQREMAGLGGVPSLVFLANEIYRGSESATATVPYSTVLGIQSTSHPVGDLVDKYGKLLPMPVGDEVVINSWLADDLAAQGSPISVGDEISFRSFVPETIHGSVTERIHRCRVAGIAAMSGLAKSQDVVPTVEGVTDEESIADWDPPFPFERERVRTTAPHDEDDQYWKQYGSAPKMFIPLARAREIAGSRFGKTTAWHLPSLSQKKLDELAVSLAAAVPPQSVGLVIRPLAARAHAAAKGSTPFGILFLTLSSFIVVAAIILLWLCFGLLVSSQHRTFGVLAAIGWRPRRIAKVLTVVAGPPICLGVLVGTFLSPLWSKVLLMQLGEAWSKGIEGDAATIFTVTAPNVMTLFFGATMTVCIAMAAIFTAALRTGAQPPLRLFHGSVAGFAGLPLWFRPWGAVSSLFGLAGRNVLRRPLRSLSVVLMVCLAEFLIVFVSGFELVDSGNLGEWNSPTGGWTHVAKFANPTSLNPSVPSVSELLSLNTSQCELLEQSNIVLLRSNQGDDANCSNLFATRNPRIVGLPDSFLDRGGFRFLDHIPLRDGQKNPWHLLQMSERRDGEIPIVVDAATSQWALKLGGIGSIVRLDPSSGTVSKDVVSGTQQDGVRCRIVGLLEPSILQGLVLIGEDDFTRLFPLQSGYAMALVDMPENPPAGVTESESRGQIEQALAAAWADFGVRFETTQDRLSRLFAVQNTFLAGFQSLGTIGLFLGTVGVAVVAIQGLLERRNTLAILLAMGFRRRRLGTVLWLESMILVALGIFLGGMSGVLAATPFTRGAEQSLPWGWLVLSAGGTFVVASIASLSAGLWLPVANRPLSD
ncbi:MAG: FtsX-like permease family protein [Pirellulales bacterium]